MESEKKLWKLDFPTFSCKIPKYFHIMEEVQFSSEKS